MSKETQFQPGETGNKSGRPISLRRAVTVASRPHTQAIADALVKRAVGGDAAAVALIVGLQSRGING